MTAERTRVIIADDHPMLIDGVSANLAADPHLQVVATARSFGELLKLLPTAKADVVVLDIGKMGGSPLPLLEQLKHDYPQLAVIVFSSAGDLVRSMLKAGAKAYVVKEDASAELVAGIHAVRNGKQFLSRKAQEYVARSTTATSESNLAPQEINVLRLLAEGLSTQEIADHLVIDARTVYGYILKLRQKIGCHERTELAAWYTRVYGPPGT